MRYLALLTISVLLTFISTQAEAQATAKPRERGNYITLGIEAWQNDLCDELEGFDDLRVSCDSRAPGLSFFGGYQFNNSIAIEYGYRRVAGFDISIASGMRELDGDIGGDIEIDTLDIGIRGNVPSRSSAGGYFSWKVGVESWDLEFELSTTDVAGVIRPSVVITGDGTDVYYGVGWGMNLNNSQGNPTYGLIIEYTRHSLDEDDFDALAFNWVFYL